MTTKTYEAGSRIGDRIIRVQELKAQINALEAELDSEKAYLLAHAENSRRDARREPVIFS
jgi:hypothetical protein